MKKSRYLVVIKNEDAYLLHNSLYGTAIKVYDDRRKEFIDHINEEISFDYDEKDSFQIALKDQNMIIEDDINEINIINHRYESLDRSTLSIIMIVTRQCNFRCPYCYESHKNLSMDETVFKNSLDFIKKLVFKKNYKNLSVSWFGGEPTLEYKFVYRFMEELRKELPEHINLYGQMTTNAYLLDKEMFLNLLEVGVNRYQITIDGLSETNDKTRILSNGAGSWKRIMTQLKEIKKLGLDKKYTIKIRTNFTAEIMANAQEWLQLLKDNFGDDYRFTYHFEAVKDLGGTNNKYNDHTFDEEAQSIDKVLNIAKDMGLILDTSLRVTKNFGMVCYASMPNNFVIDYNGEILKCTVCLDDKSNRVGKIEAAGNFSINEGKLSKWTSYYPHQDCFQCEIYPICYARKCPNGFYIKETCLSAVKVYRDSIKSLMS